jgi:hypothetical protein
MSESCTIKSELDFFFFFFFTCLHKGRERGIRTSDIRFIRHNSQPNELPLKNKNELD